MQDSVVNQLLAKVRRFSLSIIEIIAEQYMYTVNSLQ